MDGILPPASGLWPGACRSVLPREHQGQDRLATVPGAGDQLEADLVALCVVEDHIVFDEADVLFPAHAYIAEQIFKRPFLTAASSWFNHMNPWRSSS